MRMNEAQIDRKRLVIGSGKGNMKEVIKRVSQ
jgi:hypothetical protein